MPSVVGDPWMNSATWTQVVNRAAAIQIAADANQALHPTPYETKDSGVRASYDSGMVRDTQDGKPRFDLLIPEGIPFAHQFLTRCADLMTRGLAKYGERNWELANSDTEVRRFRASAERHLMQWLCGETDEDHAAAVFFNLMAAETTAYKIEASK